MNLVGKMEISFHFFLAFSMDFATNLSITFLDTNLIYASNWIG